MIISKCDSSGEPARIIIPGFIQRVFVPAFSCGLFTGVVVLLAAALLVVAGLA